jgi:precorrin-8X/cobalt-precorrin-8 methylmutase
MAGGYGYGYEHDGGTIYQRSFATIRGEARLDRFPPEVERVVVRMIHACGMVDLAADVDFAPEVVLRARSALLSGAPVLCDTSMVASGVTRRRLPAGNDVVCSLHEPGVADLADQFGTTRSAAALEHWGDRLDGALVAVGNAPTALFHLLEMLERTAARPAAVLGLPVGFVGAAESKAALAANPYGVPYLVVAGRRGGSAMAAAAVNAVASEDE